MSVTRCAYRSTIAGGILLATWLIAASASAVPAASASPTAQRAAIADWAPNAIALDRHGRVYVSDCWNARIYRIGTGGQIKVVAGAGPGGFINGFSGDGGPAIKAHFGCPYGMAFDRQGNLYVSDHLNNRIRKINRRGIVTTVVGGGKWTGPVGKGNGDGGPATEASMWGPVGIVFDHAGNMYFADRDDATIRKVNTRGIITTIAGTGTVGYSGDGGPATKAELNRPLYLAFDRHGDLLFTDSGNNRIRTINRRGIITTVAGTGAMGAQGDGGPAIAAHVQNPNALAFSPGGQLLFTQDEKHRVRMITPHGVVLPAVGNGTNGCKGIHGGWAPLAELEAPSSVAFDRHGRLYVVDAGCATVLRIDHHGRTHVAAAAPLSPAAA